MTTYRGELHGMVWDSEMDLHLSAPTVEQATDLTLSWGDERDVPDDLPLGDVLAHLTDPGRDRRLYTVVRQRDRFLLRFHRLAEFDVAADLRTATYHPAPSSDAGFASVLAVGMLASTLLMLRGQPVLHGSAVEDDGVAIALVGASGMGKSTLCTLLCQTGSALVTDDVLVVESPATTPVCRTGAVESRLRSGASYLLAEGGSTSRTTADGRLTFSPGLRARDRLPLAAIGVPYPTRGCQVVTAEHLSKTEAMLELLRFPRIVGWQDASTLAKHFDFLATLVDRVPVMRLRIPWSDRLTDGTAVELRDALHRR